MVSQRRLASTSQIATIASCATPSMFSRARPALPITPRRMRSDGGLRATALSSGRTAAAAAAGTSGIAVPAISARRRNSRRLAGSSRSYMASTLVAGGYGRVGKHENRGPDCATAIREVQREAGVVQKRPQAGHGGEAPEPRREAAQPRLSSASPSGSESSPRASPASSRLRALRASARCRSTRDSGSRRAGARASYLPQASA